MRTFFLDGLPPQSSSTEISTMSSTREHAQCGLRGDRIGAADHPGQMEGVRDGGVAWTDLPKSTNVCESVFCRESGLFFCWEFQTEETKRISGVARGQKISLFHRQSLREVEKLSLHAFDSCRALDQKEAMQSFLTGRSTNVFASSFTVVPVDVSRDALAEHLETIPFLDELLPSQDSNLLTGDLESVLRLEPQLHALNEALGATNGFDGPDIKTKHAPKITSSNLVCTRSRLKLRTDVSE